ncbi:MAG: histidinol dehydrogenase [Spirochaetes bacterium]|nr:histidinol dehydrogenase [Spirochaetota bacterium]
MIKINSWVWKSLSADQKEKLISRSDSDIKEAMQAVIPILESVKKNKDRALIEYTKKFDKADISKRPIKVTEQEFAAAEKNLATEVKKAIEFSILNVVKFHKKQLPVNLSNFKILPGITTGERFLPIDSAGLYVPHGRGSFPSMLYMLAVPALVAKVNHVCAATPPNSDGSVDPACLFAAKVCEIKEVYRVGGAQAIAALAFGTESIKPVVKIVGPGSAYVTAAKRALYGKIDVGVPAGPSDSIVLADEKADPHKATLDLLTEAEHGSDSAALLITDSDKLAESVKKNIQTIVAEIPEPRKKYLADVFSKYGGIILAKDMNEAAEIVNLYAPEHLQIATKDPGKTLMLIRNASEILLGQDTPFSIANYTTGPNAVLPTGGMARTYSPVSVRDFMKSSSIIHADKTGLKLVKDHVVALADYEGFSTHSAALTMRKAD